MYSKTIVIATIIVRYIYYY